MLIGLCRVIGLLLVIGISASGRIAFAQPELQVELADGAVLKDIVTVKAIANSETDTIARVEFRVNDVLKATDTSVPYLFEWDTLESPDGSYRLTVRAVDTAGQETVQTLTVRVDNTEEKTAVEHAQAAARLLESKDYKSAILAARKSLRLEPGQEQASSAMARALLEQGEISKALPVMEEAIKSHPDSPHLRQLLAAIHARRGLTAARDLGDFSDALKAAQEEQQKALDLLIAEAKAKAENNSKDAAFQVMLACLYLERRSIGDSERVFRQAFNLSPNDPDIALTLAMYYWMRGKFRDASYTLQGLVRSKGDTPSTHAGLAAILLEQRKTEEAIAECNKWLEREPQSVPLNQVLTYAYLLKGETAKASQTARLVFEAHPEDWATQYLVGCFYGDSGDVGEAIEYSNKAIEFSLLRPEPYLLRGYVHLRMGLFDAASSEFDLALLLNPNDPGALCGMALARVLLKQADEAESFAQKAVAAAPNAPYTHLAMAFVYHQQKKNIEQRQSLDRAREIDYVNFPFMIVPDTGRVISLCNRYQRKTVIWTGIDPTAKH